MYKAFIPREVYPVLSRTVMSSQRTNETVYLAAQPVLCACSDIGL